MAPSPSPANGCPIRWRCATPGASIRSATSATAPRPTPPFRTDDWPAWNDAPIGPRGSPEKRDPEVPTKETAEAQAWDRKAAAAKKVLEDYDAWQKKRKPARN